MLLNEVIDLLKEQDSLLLFKNARKVRDSIFDRSIFQRGVIEFSNHCRKNCHYCGLRMDNKALGRFSMDRSSILATVRIAIESGMGTIVLQSGEQDSSGFEHIGFIIKEIKKNTELAVTLCLGDQSEDTYKLWRDCGADRYLLKAETFDEKLHSCFRPGQSIKRRLKNVETLQKLGYETGSGIITGLPGMTVEILAEDLLKLSRLALDMIAVGPFVPHPCTPLGKNVPGAMDESLRAVALLRIMNPLCNIPSTSALDALSAQGRELGLYAGANVIMPSITPEQVRAGYTIYPGKNSSTISVKETIGKLQQRVCNAGYQLSSLQGKSPNKNEQDQEFINVQ
ncbi:[FeFe] hydrogenase H-cluster radical SAM maturase HydE [Maridesulfovibrio zosterae]|uniref:[FeFe] hydrogenase H-cluster radical SAM maturase HydE n=1 Tax=Maridesulfovibrio zosterae TaxID=82171 RepID=UPI0004886179|nr:[FeFe] hydrogenase H-cluster radical SAM maturase HydE [Maridesulfovibrio zosterae]